MSSTRVLTDASGNTTDTFDYAADGILLSHTGTTVCPFQFQGEYTDADTGLVYLRARWMNPQTGRFLGMDGYEGSRQEPATLHKYSFVGGDGGVNDTDPSGNYFDTAFGQPSPFDTAYFAMLKGTGIGTSMKTRLPASMLTLSSSGTDFVRGFEDLYLDLDDDDAGNCTIGFGHLVHRGHTVSKGVLGKLLGSTFHASAYTSEAPYLNGVGYDDAESLFETDVEERVLTANRLLKNVALAQNEYDAIVSYIYNAGEGAFVANLLPMLQAGNLSAMPTQLMTRMSAGGTLYPGLVDRRFREARLFSVGIYETKSFSIHR